MDAQALITLPGDHVISIADWDALKKFLRLERGTWSWLQRDGLNEVARQVNLQWQNLNAEIEQQEAYRNHVSVVSGAVQTAFTTGPLVYSESPDGRRIEDIKDRLGPAAGSAAYAMSRSIAPLGAMSSGILIKGAIEYLFPALGPQEEVLTQWNTERRELRETAKKLVDRYDKTERGLVSRFNAMEEQAAVRLDELVKSRRRLIDDAIRGIIAQARDSQSKRAEAWAKFSHQIEVSIADIKNTEATYAEKLGLEAPVTYWKKKARLHKLKEAQHLRTLRFYFAGASVGILFVFYQAAVKLHDLVLIPTPVLIVVGAGLALFSALLLWVARILTRLYLSEHHLRTDSEERATMANAYLALTHRGSLESADKAIILQALFRPSVDGVVKDEGPPDLNAIVALSKIGMPGPPR